MKKKPKVKEPDLFDILLADRSRSQRNTMGLKELSIKLRDEVLKQKHIENLNKTP